MTGLASLALIMSASLLFKIILEKLAEIGLLETGPLAMVTVTELLDTADLIMKDVVNEEGVALTEDDERMVKLDSDEAEVLVLLFEYLHPLHSGAVRTFRLQSQQRLQTLKMEM